MKFVTPAVDQVFTVTSGAAWPHIPFETDGSGPHTWQWTIEWGGFQKSGTASTAGNTWDAQPAIVNCGGTLTVVATNGGASASVAVKVRGTNPSQAEILAYLATKDGSSGFDRIVWHETKGRHFKGDEPYKSFDNGYGLTQLTTPPPTFEQVWNWKMNIDAGLKLFDDKRKAAKAYLSQNNRAFTEAQLRYETVCRWNGGSYHEWDAASNKWIRTRTILCDKTAQSIGWDMTDPANAGKTEAELHARDGAAYSKPRPKNAPWRYFGACYADSLLA